MDQDPRIRDNQEENPKDRGEYSPAQAGIDLDKILLPKKEVHDPINAPRISAGALLEQEQGATLPHPQPAPEPPTPPKSKEEESIVKPLETYQGDIESLVQKKNLSVVSIAAAEAARRATASEPAAEPAHKGEFLKQTLRFGMIAGGVLLIFIAIGLTTAAYLRLRPLPILQSTAPSPFIATDATSVVAFRTHEITRPYIMPRLVSAREGVALPLGLISRIFIAEASTTPEGEVQLPLHPQVLLSTLSLNMPAELLRTITQEYMLGVHSFDGNQPFLILRVDSYPQAYSGMLKWERYIRNELSPLFARTPRPRTPEELASISTSSSPQFLGSEFYDVILENHDTRAVYNQNGDILLLWTFLDRNTLFIATNEYTLREVLSRFAASPGTIGQ